MAAPTTTHSVTVRKLSSTITSLWAKIKSTFQTLGNMVTAWGSTPSDTKYPSEKLVKTSLDGKAADSDVLHKAGLETVSGQKWFEGGFCVFNTSNVGYGHYTLPGTGAGTRYDSWPEEYKDGAHFREWSLSFNTGVNFWGKLRITIVTSYSSFNASGSMQKTINCAFNTMTVFNNTGYYNDLGINSENEFRISDLIWNNTTACWEIKIHSIKPTSNNSVPVLLIEFWTYSATNRDSARDIHWVSASPSIVTDTTYYTKRSGNASTSPGTGGVQFNWADKPVQQSPYGYEIFNRSHTIPVGNGGTGKTTAKAAQNALLGGMNSLSTDAPSDASLVFKYASPTDADGAVFTRPLSKIWTWINSQISSVLGLTATSYGGNAATATTAAGYTSGGAIDTALQGKVTSVAYDSTNKKLTETINGTTTDVVSVATLKTDLSLAKGDVGLGNVDNTSDATKKTNFTGSVAASDYGFPTGDAVYRAIEDRAHDVVYISTSTTASQVSSYLHDNKYLVLLTPISSGSSIFARLPLVSVVSGTSAKYIFSAISGATRYSMTLDATDGWGALSSASVENTANKVTSFQSTPDDSHYPSEKLTKDSLDSKAPKDDGLTTHDTTKFYRADGSWATPPTGRVSPEGSAGVPVYIDSSGNPVACTMMGSQNGSLLGKMFSTSSQSADTLFFCMLTQNWVNGRYLSIDNAKKMLNGVFAFSTSSNKVYTLYSDSATANLPDGALISITNRGASGTTVTVKRTSSSSTTVGVGTTRLFNKSNGSWYAVVVS